MAEKHIKVAPAVHDSQDKRVLVFNTVDDDIFAHGQAAGSKAKIFIAGASNIRKPATTRKRSVMVSMRRLAISMLPLSLAV